jgi:hypothetical protein
MPADTSAGFEWVVFAVMGVVAAVILGGCAMKGRTGTTQGTVIAKGFRAAGTYTPYAHGSSRGFRTMSPVAIPASWILDVETSTHGVLKASIAESAGADYKVGDRVVVEYLTKRSLGLFKRTLVRGVRPAL